MGDGLMSLVVRPFPAEAQPIQSMGKKDPDSPIRVE